MPYAAKRPCPSPGCRELISASEKRCPAHARLQNKERGSRDLGRYDHAWRKFRLTILARDPLCVLCLEKTPQQIIRASTVADHIVSLKAEPERRLDPTNVRGLCS